MKNNLKSKFRFTEAWLSECNRDPQELIQIMLGDTKILKLDGSFIMVIFTMENKLFQYK